VSDIETEIVPPDVDGEGDGDEPSARLSVWFLDVDNIHRDAAMQFVNGCTPEQFADAVLNVCLALAHLRGPEYAWALTARLADYDGHRP
jgi:hypothetical protein